MEKNEQHLYSRIDNFFKNGLKAIMVLAIFVFTGLDAFPVIKINTNYENGHLDKYKIIEPDTILIGPISKHKDSWFSFKISGVKNKRIVMVFEWINDRKIGSNYDGVVNNAGMVSYDGNGFEIIKDVHFRMKNPNNSSGNYIQTLTHTFGENEALVCYCAPWSNTRLADLAQGLNKDKRVQISNIGLSKFKQLPLTYFKITDHSVSDKDKKKLFLIGREDSYEAGGSWAIEGLMKFILSDDPVAKEMLKRMVFVIFPIFSVDGVALGATNFPLDPENSKFVYVTSDWDMEPSPYYEVGLMKDFWKKLKSEGFEADIAFKFHSTCYWQCHFRAEDCAPENKAKEMELLNILTTNLSWRIQDGPLGRGQGYMNANFIKVFPNAITYSSHNDFVFTQRYINSDKVVYRRHEDVLQDGELIARSYASFYGIKANEAAPYLMAGDIDKNNGKKGAVVTYSVYYYDLNQMAPAKIEVIINGKAFTMKCEGTPDYIKPVKYSYITTLSAPVNNYCFKATNGKQERKVPEDNYLLPGPFILN